MKMKGSVIILFFISSALCIELNGISVKRIDSEEPSTALSPLRLNSLSTHNDLKKSPTIDYCYYCVDFMGEAVDDLLNGILNGLLGSCADLCSYLENQALEVPCILICEYVGFNEFVNVVNDTDPDPIYICQEVDFCPVVNGGQVQMVDSAVSPSSAPSGATFNLTFTYKVIKPTGPGLLSILLIPPVDDQWDFIVGADFFQEGQAPGVYQGEVAIGTQPSEQEPFNPGEWIANTAVCEGDCTTDHPYGGVYAQINATFTILNATIAF